MDCYTVLKGGVLTEKTARLTELGKYVFWIDRRANKIEVKKAIEKIYKVKVKNVRIMNVKGKVRRLGRLPEGKTSVRKKAIVTLQKGYEIRMV